MKGLKRDKTGAEIRELKGKLRVN